MRVYTAIQQGVIDGAENNELALTNNKHGEVAKYFSYDMHQTVPDMLIVNRNFINGPSEDELEIFKEAARILLRVEQEGMGCLCIPGGQKDRYGRDGRGIYRCGRCPVP